ncbi:hypothetical protein ACS0TY_007093 [Phlomoides rotata]
MFRYVYITILQYKEVLGKGACKKVYRAFDEWEGIEVAWNQVKVADLLRNSVEMDRLRSEVHLLKTLKHKNIIKFYNSWVDPKKEHINFITEIFTSGNLREYRKKHKHVDLRALKKWSRQILQGLSYLHRHDPPVIHRDLKCDNIFVNGNQGEVKIGDLGLAAFLQRARAARSVIGTPEFMAPELYEEEYNELVDIYAFGMCMLELVTLEYPYAECTNAAQIYRKVSSGIKPASLGKVKDPEVRTFIEKCIAKVSDRLSAGELLMDPFLQSVEESRGCSLQSPSTSAAAILDDNGNRLDNCKIHEDSVLEGSRDFTVQGQRKDQNTIFLKLRIEDSLGHVRIIHFPFDIEKDTSTAVASEMVEELDLTDQDVSVIADMIDSEFHSLIPDWAPKAGDSGAPEDASPKTYDTLSSALVLEKLPSGRKYWSDSPKAGAGNSSLRPADSVPSGDNWFEEKPQSRIIHNDVNNSCNASPLRHVEYDSDCGEWEEASAPSDPQNGTQSMMVSSETDTGDVKIIVKKLDHVLDEQLKELNEMKEKHKVAVLDLVKELPQETLQRVLSKCNKKINGRN